MDEEWPDHFEERSRAVAATAIEEEGDRKHDAMANMVARPQSLQDYLHDQLGWFDLEPPSCGQMATGSSTTSTPTAICRRGSKTSIDPDARPRAIGAGPAGAGASCRSSIRRASAARDLRECLLLQLTPGMPLLRGAARR